MKAVLPIVWNVWAIKRKAPYDVLCCSIFIYPCTLLILFVPIMTLIVTWMAYGLACQLTRKYLKKEKEKFAGI